MFKKGYLTLPLILLSLLVIYKLALTNYQYKDKFVEDKAIEQSKKNDDTVLIDIPKKYLLGKFVPAKDTIFKKIPVPYTKKAEIYLHKEVLNAFIRMHKQAKKEGVDLRIISATRTFKYQKFLWERKWKGITAVEGKNLATEIKDPVERARIILKYSAMPGTSRHHWGTDIDINSLNNSYFASGKGKKEFEWLTKNASKFGFCQTYNKKGGIRKTGYEEEKWHWSYTPLANHYLKNYLNKIKYTDITGFGGSETAEKLNVIENYVHSINKNCLP